MVISLVIVCCIIIGFTKNVRGIQDFPVVSQQAVNEGTVQVLSGYFPPSCRYMFTVYNHLGTCVEIIDMDNIQEVEHKW